MNVFFYKNNGGSLKSWFYPSWIALTVQVTTSAPTPMIGKPF